MNSTHYFGIIVRLFAIALFIYGIDKLSFLFDFSFYTENIIRPSIVFSLVASVLPILMAIFVWFFPLTVARKILPSTDEKVQPISPASILTVLILAIGTYTFYYAIVDALYWISVVHMFVTDEFGNISKTLPNEDKSFILSTVVEFILAVVLLTKARTISHALIKFTK